MGKTSIEWTDASWNPIVGCTEVSPGCANCYAARLAASRLAHVPAYKGLATIQTDNPKGGNHQRHARWTGNVRFLADRLNEPEHWRKPRRIFVCDMGDLFHDAVSDEIICKVFAVMSSCRRHTFQVLTKRADRMLEIILRCKPWEGWITLDGKLPHAYGGKAPIVGNEARWPMPNVWLGVSVENQHFADERIPLLLKTPAAVRFISAEPLLGPVHLRADWAPLVFGNVEMEDELDWVIAGGESGPHARPMDPAWPRALRDQCQAAGVPFFFKQWGVWLHANQMEGTFQEKLDSISKHTIVRDQGKGDLYFKVGKKASGRLLDGREWNEFPEERG